MTIGILLHPYGEKYKAGLGEYILSLTRALIENDQERSYIVYVKKGAKVQPTFAGNNWKVVEVGWGPLWRDIGLLFVSKSDLYVFNTPVLPFFYTPGRTLAIVLDFAYWHLPAQSFSQKVRNALTFCVHWLSIKRADILVAISEATKQDIIKLCHVLPEKVKVIYPGVRDLSKISESKPKFAIPKSYFLFAGVLKPRKNALETVRGFIEARQKHHIQDKLIIVGKGGGTYLEQIKQEITEDGIQDEVLLVGYVSDGELAYMMKRAKAFVFPSLFEGFGMPVIEAMKCGVPVITSNTSALLEAGDHASVQVDPHSFLEIAHALVAIQDEGERRKYIARGLEKSKTFTWEISSKEFCEVFKD